MQNIEISVIISVYNGEEYIERCVNSVLKQEYKVSEIVLYDDKSTDNTPNIIKKYEKKYPGLIKSYISDINRGPGGGKQKGFELSTKKWFSFIDADDYIDKDYIKLLVKSLIEYKKEKNDFPDMVISGFKKVDETGKVLYMREYADENQGLYSAVSNCAKLFSRNFFLKNNIEIPEGKVLEDVLTKALVICSAPKIKISNKNFGYNYFKNTKSVSNTYMKNFISGVAEKEMAYLIKNKRHIKPEYYDMYIYNVYKIICWHLLKSGSNVGRKNMEKEYRILYSELNKNFKGYKQNKYLSGKEKILGERKIVFWVVRIMFLLEKLKIQKIFLSIYSSFDFSVFWPKM